MNIAEQVDQTLDVYENLREQAIDAAGLRNPSESDIALATAFAELCAIRDHADIDAVFEKLGTELHRLGALESTVVSLDRRIVVMLQAIGQLVNGDIRAYYKAACKLFIRMLHEERKK